MVLIQLFFFSKCFLQDCILDKLHWYYSKKKKITEVQGPAFSETLKPNLDKIKQASFFELGTGTGFLFQEP